MTDTGTGRPSLLAGAARGVLPAAAGVPLAGYIERRGVAEGVHDDLEVGALALRDGASELVVATVDLVGVDRRFVVEVAGELGIAPGSLMLGATHTHSGPDSVVARPAGVAVDEAYRTKVRGAVVEAIARARQRQLPARLRLARGAAAGVAANRNDPAKRVDQRVTVLIVDGTDGAPIASVVHFPCHPTVLGPANLRVSADFPGALRERLRAGPAPVLFLNGASGDVSTRFTRRGQGFDEVDRVARILAEAATAASASAENVAADSLRTAAMEVNLPAKVVPTVSAARGRLRTCRTALAAAEAAGASPQTMRRLVTAAQGAETELARAEGRGLTAAPVHLVATRFGNLALLAVSAEISSAVGAAIEAHDEGLDTIVVGLSGGYCGYVVDPADYVAGTYESLTSPFHPDADRVLVGAAGDLLASLA